MTAGSPEQTDEPGGTITRERFRGTKRGISGGCDFKQYGFNVTVVAEAFFQKGIKVSKDFHNDGMNTRVTQLVRETKACVSYTKRQVYQVNGVYWGNLGPNTRVIETYNTHQNCGYIEEVNCPN